MTTTLTALELLCRVIRAGWSVTYKPEHERLWT